MLRERGRGGSATVQDFPNRDGFYQFSCMVDSTQFLTHQPRLHRQTCLTGVGRWVVGADQGPSDLRAFSSRCARIDDLLTYFLLPVLLQSFDFRISGSISQRTTTLSRQKRVGSFMTTPAPPAIYGWDFDIETIFVKSTMKVTDQRTMANSCLDRTEASVRPDLTGRVHPLLHTHTFSSPSTDS